MKTIPFKKALLGIALTIVGTLAHSSAATFVVSNTNDAGPGSLRDALTQANSNGQADTINFDGGFFSSPRTITLTSGELLITRDGSPGFETGRLLTINGPGADLLTISGNNTSRIFYVSVKGNLAMSGITVRDGNGVGTVLNNEGTSGGGMIAHDAFLSLSNMTFRNNSVPDSGGAIYLSSIRSFTMTDSLVTENFAHRFGGGISAPFVEGAVTFRNTVISNNSTHNRVGGLAIDKGVTTIENCLITGNRAGLLNLGLPAGGGSFVGGLSLFQTTATVTDTTISNNTAGVAPSGSNEVVHGVVGGVYADGSNMVFRRVTVSGNTAYPGGGQPGGGMHLRAASSSITVIDSTVSGNQAISTARTAATKGGGIFTEGSSGTINVINTTIANNAVTGIGGGIANFMTNLRVINSTIVNNTASGDGPGIPGGGGGINNADSFNAVIRIQIQNTIVANNRGRTSDNFGPDVVGTFVSNGYNLIGNTSGSTGFGAAGDQLGVDPLLDQNGLQDNGGATLTIALQPNSPAIDKGKSADVATDQRGVARPTDNPSIANAAGGDGSDIGAYEVGAPNGVAEKTLGNIATRLPVQTGENVLIGGIIVVGDAPKRLIIRALGPSLSASGISGVLQDPVLELYQGDNLLASNDNWRSNQEGEIASTGIAPSDNREAAIVATVQPGNYTAVIRGAGDSTGIGLVEVYDLEQRPDSKLANISSRGFVASGENVLIGGFIVGPTTKVVVRAIGPALANGGVQGALQDPTLDLVNANGEVLRANDNWKSSQREELEAIGIQPSDDRESALIATLTAGNYTAVVRGAGGTTGVGLVEVYNLP